MGRTCREELASGGTLIISENDFRIEYFFPGPDGRYGGVRVNIPGRKVETYMRAWQKNYERYEELQKAAGASVVKRPAAMRGVRNDDTDRFHGRSIPEGKPHESDGKGAARHDNPGLWIRSGQMEEVRANA